MPDKECILYDRKCIYCGECDICDLDSSKICDNCGKCLDIDSDYKEIIIDEIIGEEELDEFEDEELDEFDEN